MICIGKTKCTSEKGLLYQINKLMSVFLCVCPVIDHEFRHHIVKVAADPLGYRLVDPQLL